MAYFLRVVVLVVVVVMVVDVDVVFVCIVQVDALGGWHESLAAVRSVSGLSADAPLHCVSWPPVLR